MALHAEWRRGLEQAGLDQQRRPSRVIPAGLKWTWGEERTGGDQQLTDEHLELSFSLPAGAYATSLLREVIECEVFCHGREAANEV